MSNPNPSATRPGLDVLADNDPPRILLVDDEATGRRLLRRWIERCFSGYVVEANNGLEALEALAAEPFDLVVLDLLMPVLDGTETLSLIRSDPGYGDIEVVIASQMASEQKVKDVISLGVTDYILKPLRYESVVDRLHQTVNRARAKKKARAKKSGLPTVLIADPDPNFCDFAESALSNRFRCIAAHTAAETLVAVLKSEPQVALLSPNLPGLPFEMLSKKVVTLAEARQCRVFLITESRSDTLAEGFAGQLVRTFVPESFSASVVALMGGVEASTGPESWLNALEPELVSAVRQAMGMMTGFEPTCIEEPADQGAADVSGAIDLHAENGEFELVVDLRCRRPFAVALCNAMLGGEETDIDDEFMMSGIGEILNVVGGRIKNSCANRKIEVTLGLPQLREVSEPPSKAFYHWKQYFHWQTEYWFLLRVYALRGEKPPSRSSSPETELENKPEPVAPAPPTQAAPADAETPEATAEEPSTSETPVAAETAPTPAEAGASLPETPDPA